MAEKKIVSATTGKEVKGGNGKITAAPSGKSTVGLRVCAVILWVCALVCEFFALRVMTEMTIIPFLSSIEPLYQGIGFLVLDLILVIIGAQLWKKANHINPMSEKNKALFWLWNNMGVIACAICFLPFIILLLTNKDADKKTKTVGTIAAAVALLIGGVASYDFNPVSAEQLASENPQVYWTAHGKKFHTFDDCTTLNRSEELTAGTIAQAEEAGRESLCKVCQKRMETEGTTPAAIDTTNADDTTNVLELPQEAVDAAENALENLGEAVNE